MRVEPAVEGRECPDLWGFASFWRHLSLRVGNVSNSEGISLLNMATGAMGNFLSRGNAQAERQKGNSYNRYFYEHTTNLWVFA